MRPPTRGLVAAAQALRARSGRRRSRAPSPGGGVSASVGVQSSSCRATHSTWSGVKLPESRRISSSVFRYSCSNEMPGLRERADAEHELLALPAAHPRELVELVELAPLRGNPVAVAEQPVLARRARGSARGARSPTAGSRASAGCRRADSPPSARAGRPPMNALTRSNTECHSRDSTLVLFW